MKTQVPDIETFRQKALHWAAGFDTCCYLHSNDFNDSYGKFDCIIGIGATNVVKSPAGAAFEALQSFRAAKAGWAFGFLGYDLKNEIEKLSSANPDGLNFSDLYFFVPKVVIVIKGDEVEIFGDGEEVLEAIQQVELSLTTAQSPVQLQPRLTKQQYTDRVNLIKAHIARGDIYVTNFCQEFYAEDADIDALAVYQKLNSLSPTPFSAFMKWEGNYLICASPERFLAKRGSKLISQPIKGTAPRSRDEHTDALNKHSLRHHPKELQENVMIVDLVRNDLTHSAQPGTVQTEELFGIRSFNQVHQMVSTVVCELRDDVSAVQAIKNTFPMGSMTGAPKVSAMQLMEQHEQTKRGVYSGALGYFSSDGDFDFNVVIRTLLYNSTNKYLSFQAGSAITFHADAEHEYEECLLKAKAIMEVLGSNKL